MRALPTHSSCFYMIKKNLKAFLSPDPPPLEQRRAAISFQQCRSKSATRCLRPIITIDNWLVWLYILSFSFLENKTATFKKVTLRTGGVHPAILSSGGGASEIALQPCGQADTRALPHKAQGWTPNPLPQGRHRR